MQIKNFGKIYIIHHAPLANRKEFLDRQIQELKIPDLVVFDITYKNKPLTKKQFSFYDSSKYAWQERKRIFGSIIEGSNHPLKENEIRVCLRHIKLLKKIAAKRNNKIYMIAEDDIIFQKDFYKKLNILVSKLENLKWDVCYIGKGGVFIDPQPKRDEEVEVYAHKLRSSNGASSYLITPKSAKKFLEHLNRFVLAIDAEYGYIQKKYKFNVFWSVPFLTKEGSIEGLYSSDVRKSSKTEKLNKIIKSLNKINPKLAEIFAKLLFEAQRIKNYIRYSRPKQI